MQRISRPRPRERPEILELPELSQGDTVMANKKNNEVPPSPKTMIRIINKALQIMEEHIGILEAEIKRLIELRGYYERDYKPNQE